MQLSALLITTAALLVGADEAADKAKKELARLDGTWTVKSLIYSGEDHSGGDEATFQLTFKDGQATVGGNDNLQKEYGKVTFKLDPSYSPKLVDITVGGAQKGIVIEGIYELKDDEFTLCARIIGKERPTQFASKEGSSVVLLVLKRAK